MPIPVQCPHCRAALGAPEEFAGRPMRCANCQQVFPVPALPAAPRLVPPAPPPPAPAAQANPFAFEEQAQTERSDPNSIAQIDPDDLDPHRGPLLVMLGFISLALILLPPLGAGLGGFTSYLAQNDLRAMRRKYMDPAGRGQTQLAEKLGGAAALIGGFLTVTCCVLIRVTGIFSR
jgi:hypothetical protein